MTETTNERPRTPMKPWVYRLRYMMSVRDDMVILSGAGMVPCNEYAFVSGYEGDPPPEFMAKPTPCMTLFQTGPVRIPDGSSLLQAMVKIGCDTTYEEMHEKYGLPRIVNYVKRLMSGEEPLPKPEQEDEG